MAVANLAQRLGGRLRFVEAEASVAIPARFNGPPESANGGFTCGTVASLLESAAAEVNLRRPPPLDRRLDVAWEGARVALRDGDSVIAEGEPTGSVEVNPPRSVGVEEARQASRRYPWFEQHAFPSCFVCGPHRPHHDGLELFAGPSEDGIELCATDWVPEAEWSNPRGAVRREIVWAALDCPSAVPVMASDSREAPAVLARLTASLEAPVAVGAPHVVVAWLLGSEGRKLHSASAILDPDGNVLARARALWIELRRGD